MTEGPSKSDNHAFSRASLEDSKPCQSGNPKSPSPNASRKENSETSEKVEESSSASSNSQSRSERKKRRKQTKEGKKVSNHLRSCCFCWCCCCSCSCLSVKNQPKTRGMNSADSFSALAAITGGSDSSETQPTLEDILSWGQSFDKLMKCAAGRRVFREFLQCEYSEENLLFWLACEDLKRERDAAVIEEKARVIYEDYISILSPKEVSLDSRVREVVNQNMAQPNVHVFDEAQLQIYTLMHRDSYPRFLASRLYRQIARLSPPPAGRDKVK